MASALKKAAEAAGIAAQPTSAMPPVEKAPEIVSAAPHSISSGSAAAPAPAKEKLPVVAPPPAPVVETPAELEQEKAEAAFSSAHNESSPTESHAPSFSMGAPAVDEEEAPNSKKAIIILAIVAILASMAGYLAWKNMSDKSPAKAPAPQVQAPATSSIQPSPATPSPAVNDTVTSPATVSANSVSAAPEPAAPIASTKPSLKMIAKDSTKSLATAAAAPAPSSNESPAPSPAAPALVVHNEGSRPASKAGATDSESAPSASALGLTANADPNALSAIGNAPAAVPKATNQVIRVSQGVSEGLILKKVAPRYPAQALSMRLEGSVQMQATVSKDGSITNVKVLNGDALLARSAVEAVKQWKYKPYYLDGEPVEIQTQITINFKLPR
jgi:protein TonB